MLGKLADWFDHRTGYRTLRDTLLLEHIPGGAKWRYVWGSTLAFVFMIQAITGVLLMTAYSAGDTTAWGSVFFIQYQMDFGWLIRGLHHFGSQTMVVLLAVHMLQVVIAGAHLPPREINWWLGLALLGMVLGLSLTGYLLPWDQKGYYATQVATNIMGGIPVIGPFLQKVVVGGTSYGNQTLTHFYALHVGILPPILIALLIAHIAIFRRHGLTTPTHAQGEGMFWPDQAFRDLVVCLIIFGAMVAVVLYGHGHPLDNAPTAEAGLYERMAHAGQAGLGANLDAPADPLNPYPARPEWYFLFLFQFLKYFEGDQEIIGTLVVPNAVMLILAVLPVFGYGRMRKIAHFTSLLFVLLLFAGVGLLTLLALAADSAEPYPGGLGGGTKTAKDLNEKFRVAEREARRAVNLAAQGIPEEGARGLLRGDPQSRGPKLFQEKCAVCHSFTPPTIVDDFKGITLGTFKASDLGGFGGEKWIRALLADPGDPHFFGRTTLTGMRTWRKGINEDRDGWKKDNPQEAVKKIADQDADFDLLARWLAQQSKPSVDRDKTLESKGIELFSTYECIGCHAFGGGGGTKGPDLTNYASADWIRLMVMNPYSDARYKKKNAMPAFRPTDGPGSEIHLREFKELLEKNGIAPAEPTMLSDIDRELLVRWLTGDNRVIFGGAIIDAAPK